MPYLFVANEIQKEFLNIPTMDDVDKYLTSTDICLDFNEPEPFQEDDLTPVKSLFEPLLKGETGVVYIGNNIFSLTVL